MLNWLQKLAAQLHTSQLPQLLTQAIQYECGGQWEAGKPDSWSERLDKITGKNRSKDVGYSTSFWVSCKTGDEYFHQKWGVNITFTVISGSSHTTFDSETGDWDLNISASVQWAAPDSWTPKSPYALLVRSAGQKEDMKTIQEVANFVKESIWKDQSDEEGDEGDDDGNEPSPSPEPDVYAPHLVPVAF